jgi:hypothetical protein
MTTEKRDIFAYFTCKFNFNNKSRRFNLVSRIDEKQTREKRTENAKLTDLRFFQIQSNGEPRKIYRVE